MDKQTTIAFVLIGIILVVWLYMTAPEPVVEKPKQTDSTTIVIDTLQKEQEIKPIVKEPKTQENIPTQDTVSRKNEKITTIENEVFIVELSNIGGNIHKVFLKDFNNWYSINDKSNDYYEKSVQLINYSRGNTYNLSFVSTDGKAINTGDYTFTSDKAPGKYQINGKDSIIIRFTWKVGERQEIIKSYKFNGSSYEIGSKIELSGMRDVISNNAYDLVWNNGLRFVEYNTVDEANYSNSSVYYGDEQAILDASSVGEKVQEDYHGRIDWIAVRNKYFAAVIIPDNPSNVDGAYLEGDREQISAHGVEEYYNARLILPFKNTDNETRSFKLYIGPVDYNKLKSLGSHLKALVDFGSFFGLKFVVRPIAEYVLLPLFNFLHLFIPNYGFVIVVFSLIIKIVVYPLTKQSYQSMKKMQLLQPKIAEIKEKYKDDQQKLNKETMKLYQTYGVNPAGGCLPMLLQMPIFVALWGLFRTAIELR